VALDISTTVHNERTKLTATYLNGVAIAVIAVGGLAPIFSAFYNGQSVSLLLPIRCIHLLCPFPCTTLLGETGVERHKIMTIGQFLTFLIFPTGCLIVGYIAMHSAEREAKRFDQSRNKLKPSH
jgi:Na+-driven multidrug efflux pump